MKYKENQEICNKYGMCCRCPYQIINLSNDGNFIYMCELRNKSEIYEYR